MRGSGSPHPACTPTGIRWPGGRLTRPGWRWTPEVGTSVGEELLTPTAIYGRDCLALAAGCDVHAFAHITGGGLAANLARVLPPGTGAVLDRATWRPPPVFGLLAGRGGIDAAEMERVFNMGVGMAAVVAADDADRALRVLAARDVTGWVLGEVAGQLGEVAGPGDRVRLAGAHPGPDRP